VGAFSHKFSIATSDKATDRIKKVRGGGGCKNGTDLLYHHAKYGGDHGHAPAVDEKVWCFLFRLSCFEISKFVVTEMLWS